MNHQTNKKNGGDSQVNNESCQPRHRFINKRGRPIISTTLLRKLPVQNKEGRDLGVLKDLMIETDRGTAAYAILQFEDDKSFALPFSSLQIDLDEMMICVDIQYEVFAEGTGMVMPTEGAN